MVEQKRAAVVKRGTERDRRDLFASQPTDLGYVKQTLRPPVDFGGVAARNETSVLFTVDALRNAANADAASRIHVEPEPAPLSTGYVGSDDEGVIDLKALASTPPARMGVGPRSVAPLFSEPPPGAFAADVDAGTYDIASLASRFKPNKRAIAGIAAGLVAVLLCTFGLAAAFKGEEPVVHAANAVMAPVALAAPAPVLVAPPAPVADAVTPTSASAASDVEEAKAPAVGVKARKHKGRSKHKGAARASLSKVRSSGVATKSKAPRASKAADRCGCKGDFTCVLRCSATGK